jgi:hypothetical protein
VRNDIIQEFIASFARVAKLADARDLKCKTGRSGQLSKCSRISSRLPVTLPLPTSYDYLGVPVSADDFRWVGKRVSKSHSRFIHSGAAMRAGEASAHSSPTRLTRYAGALRHSTPITALKHYTRASKQSVTEAFGKLEQAFLEQK